MTARWQFWIDVGGTFTDCIARDPEGCLHRRKVLSSSVTKGAVAAGSTREAIVDPARVDDPHKFWQGYRLRLLDEQGQVWAERAVARFDLLAGRLQLSELLPRPPRAGEPYELASGEEAPILAIRSVLGLPLGEPIPPVVVRLGTTRGTNALITRRGARTALVTTKGFGGVLEIGYQNRPKLFELAIRKREPLFAAVVEVDERIAADGQVLKPPDADEVRRQLVALRSQGIESLAICLLHASSCPQHEELVAAIAREAGWEEVSVSSRVAPLVKIVARGDTTTVDAYLNPVLRRYVGALRRSLAGSELWVLTSAGGLVAAEKFVGKDSILSGPAGGVVGFSRAAQTAGFDRAIGFDMGGTSTDVARFDGRYELEFETEKSGVRVVAPMMAIETVAAGGGSVCRFDGVKLVVGPESAGADPGPVCYGRGGPLAVTDLNLYLGRILPAYFPFPLDRRAVGARLAALADEIAAATGIKYQPVDLADGFLRIANANMVKAIRSISIAKGYDPREYVLVAFGGAAAQHACAVAGELGIRQVLSHPDAGLLSAYGIGLADVTRHAVAGIYEPYSETALAALPARFAALAVGARDEVLAEGVSAEQIEVRRSLDLRYRGVDAYLTIAEPANGTYADVFRMEHEKLYGYVHENRPLEIVSARVEVIGRSGQAFAPSKRVAASPAMPTGETIAYFHSQPQPTAVFDRSTLVIGDLLIGPAIVVEANSTT
ncbi:MAG: hydantoinase/oxoprolinase family protein, partial [Pirellulales bacterium]